jgi:anti-sigma factor (TIGR02949 family)
VNIQLSAMAANVSCKSCKWCADHLGDYAEGLLEHDLQTALQAHVASCSHCTRLVHDYLAIPRVVRRGTDCEMPQDVQSRLRRRLAMSSKS